jgi:hypothetical protein
MFYANIFWLCEVIADNDFEMANDVFVDHFDGCGRQIGRFTNHQLGWTGESWFSDQSI